MVRSPRPKLVGGFYNVTGIRMELATVHLSQHGEANAEQHVMGGLPRRSGLTWKD